MTVHKKIDDWFLGYKTRSVKAKQDGGLYFGGGRSKPSKPLRAGSGLANLRAAALKHPEVMVKIPKRLSSNSKGMRGIRNHLDYVSRNGEVPLENQSGEKLLGKRAVKGFVNDWQKLGIPEESKHKEALNIVLSMPEGTPPDAVLNAARKFAAEQFDGHQYVFGLHHDSHDPNEPKHPHVHLCVLMRDEFGRRLNPRKADLFEWRVRFAEKLREEGVLCAATKRQHRGKTLKPENSFVRFIRSRGDLPDRYKQQAEELIDALKHNDRPKHPYLREAMQTRGLILEEYGKIAKELYKMGNKTEARIISQLAKEVAGQDFTTNAQKDYDQAAQQGTSPEQLRTALSNQAEGIEKSQALIKDLRQSGFKSETEQLQKMTAQLACQSFVDMASGQQKDIPKDIPAASRDMNQGKDLDR
ncbi:relaxase/mobilization nuclease domain-containing protein [Neisseria dentiae]|uniref:relaxase/mobilization nuclease domain-containing protein n=2 Tax=Neisseria dentiae TaxID=194197 RepID=UPI0035A0A78D